MNINNPIISTNLHEFHINNNEININNIQSESIITIIIEILPKPHMI